MIRKTEQLDKLILALVSNLMPEIELWEKQIEATLKITLPKKRNPKLVKCLTL